MFFNKYPTFKNKRASRKNHSHVVVLLQKRLAKMKIFGALHRGSSYFVKPHTDWKHNYTEGTLNKIFQHTVSFFQQPISTPMGKTMYHRLLIWFFIVWIMQNHVKYGEKSCMLFNFTYRYINDILFINNPKCQLSELKIVVTTDFSSYASYLDL